MELTTLNIPQSDDITTQGIEGHKNLEQKVESRSSIFVQNTAVRSCAILQLLDVKTHAVRWEQADPHVEFLLVAENTVRSVKAG